MEKVPEFCNLPEARENAKIVKVGFQGLNFLDEQELIKEKNADYTKFDQIFQTLSYKIAFNRKRGLKTGIVFYYFGHAYATIK